MYNFDAHISKSLVSFRDNCVMVRDAKDGRERRLMLSCEEDGTLVVTDGDNEIPAFTERRKLTGFPTPEVIMELISGILGGTQTLLSSERPSIELDRAALSGLKKMPVDIFHNVYLGEVKAEALVLCLDLRNFSSFLTSNEEGEVFRLIKEFTSNLLSCVNQFGYGCNYYKLMGDGAIVIWDKTDEETVSSALGIFDSYIEFVNQELFVPYPGLGMGGALVTDKVFKYEISAEVSQLMYRDYVGYGINLSCRLQGLAHKDQLVINRNLADTGLVPYAKSESAETLSELKGLKGLKDEDRTGVLLYSPT